MALLEIIAQGRLEIIQGKVRPAEEVFADIKKRLKDKERGA
jgi:hypothetical protein